MEKTNHNRRNFLRWGAFGAATAATLAASSQWANPNYAYAQAPGNSTLRKVLDRGKLIVGTGSTNPPWHYENEKGELDGMDIAMARILSQQLFGSMDKVEYVRQEAASRIPNTLSGRVDVSIQFMTISGSRAQVVGFTRPYYVEGIAMLLNKGSKYKSADDLRAAGSSVTAVMRMGETAADIMSTHLPEARQLLVDTPANAVQAVESNRADVSFKDLSTVGWLISQKPDTFKDIGYAFGPQLYGAATRTDDQVWINFMDAAFNICMYGHQWEFYAEPYKRFFGKLPPEPKPGFPVI